MFIPSNPEYQMGDRVRLVEEVQTMAGTFTKGHVFEVTGQNDRGYDLADGIRKCGEVSSSKFERYIPAPNDYH